jgi:hypothetical protein
MLNSFITTFFRYIVDKLFKEYKRYSQMSVLFASMYTVWVHQPILFQTFFELNFGFRSHNPTMQGVLYLLSRARTADISTGTCFSENYKTKIRVLLYVDKFVCIYRVSREECKIFGGVFLMLKYTDITQNTYIQS